MIARTCAVLDSPSGGPHELVFVDDGGTGWAFEIVEAGARSDPRILLGSLSRNFGHQSALLSAKTQRAAPHRTRGIPPEVLCYSEALFDFGVEPVGLTFVSGLQ